MRRPRRNARAASTSTDRPARRPTQRQPARSRFSGGLGAHADDGFAFAALGRVERGDGVVEGRDVSDVGAKAPVAYPVNDLHQLAWNGLDDEVDRETVDGASLNRPDH